MEKTFLKPIKLQPLQYFGMTDWYAYYGISISPKKQAVIGKFPWSQDILDSPCLFYPEKTVRETHFAFVGLDNITIMKLRKLNPRALEPRFFSYSPDVWYAKKEFSNTETLKLRWYLLLKDALPGSHGKTFNEQKAMLPSEYEIPMAIVEVAKNLFLFKKTGTRANQNCYARTSDLIPYGTDVFVGDSINGVSIRGYFNDPQNMELGLAVSRKLGI